MSSSLPPVDGEGPRPRSRVLATLALALVATLVVGGLLWILGGSDTSQEQDDARTQPGESPSASASPPPASPTGTPAAGATKSPATPATKGAGTSAEPQRLPFQGTGRPTEDLDLRVGEVEAITAKGYVPGEVSGPALRITVEVENRSERAVALNTAVANFYFGKAKSPASPMIKSGARPFPTKVAPGRTASGVFVFTVPKAQRGRIVLEVNLDTALRTVEFNGGCPEDC